jgi:replication factor C subunit 3/5
MAAPWVEVYRPTRFEDIVLSPDNQTLFATMLLDGYIPNMLFHGSPGTGKTTTILNLISAYQEARNEKNKGLVIHLNASDDRGIDVLRAQIHGFVAAKTLFGGGVKFVVLDEVDYMTKPAQQSLGYLLNFDATFCIICNYISKIESSLQSCFMKIRFSDLPPEKVSAFLLRVARSEGVNLTEEDAKGIQVLFGSDLRSMVNYVQTNRSSIRVLRTTVWDTLLDHIEGGENINVLCREVEDLSKEYNTDPLSLLKDFITYGVSRRRISLQAVGELELAIHNSAPLAHLVPYVMLVLLTNPC